MPASASVRPDFPADFIFIDKFPSSALSPKNIATHAAKFEGAKIVNTDTRVVL